MPLIITATDFSDVGNNAVDYACGLAAAQQAELVIIHSFSVPVMFSDVPMPVSIVDDGQHDSEAQMSQLVAEMGIAWPELDITGKVIYGDIVDAIDEYTGANTKPWMIVVGNSTTAENGTWPDSTLLEAIKNLNYPVLAIPPGAIYTPVRNICFAFDNKHTGNDAALRQLTGLVQQLAAALQVLMIQSNEQITSIDEEAKNLLAPASPDYFFITDADIDLAITTFIAGNSTDLLVLIPRKHSFFEGLFHKSHTKAIAHSSHIPILALHEAQP